MVEQACPMPSQPGETEEATIRRLLSAKRIAVVGASNDPDRAGHYVPAYLMEQGYEVVAVNPNHREIFGRPALRSLREMKQSPEVVLVFRRPEQCGEVAKEAVAAGAKGIWLQSGVRSEEAERVAKEAGVAFVQDRCMMVEHRRRLRGEGT